MADAGASAPAAPEANVLQSAGGHHRTEDPAEALLHEVRELREEVERLRHENRQAVKATENIAASVGEHAHSRQQAEERAATLARELEAEKQAHDQTRALLAAREREMTEVEARVRVLVEEQERLATMVRTAEGAVPPADVQRVATTERVAPAAAAHEPASMEAQIQAEMARLFGKGRQMRVRGQQ